MRDPWLDKTPWQKVRMALRWYLAANLMAWACYLMAPEVNDAELKAMNNLIDAFEADPRWGPIK
jgi:hypothetical protein